MITKPNSFLFNRMLNNTIKALVKSSRCLRPLKIQQTKSVIRNKSWWANVEMGPPDPILGVSVAFAKDTSPKRMNLGIGAYRDDEGKPYILGCVRKAETKIYESKMNHEYAGITGVPEFNKLSGELVFGTNSNILLNKQVVTSQVISGTGSLRIAADFLKRFTNNSDVYVPSPTWGNHIPIMQDAGFKVKTYSYYDSKNIALDEQKFYDDIQNAPDNSIFLFHVCAHNPTGVDPSKKQWEVVSDICKKKGHFVLFDMAYQGFASGDPENDVWPVRHFIDQGQTPIICQSFAKNFGLYGERAGALHIVTDNPSQTEKVDSQLKILIRPHYSNPPIHGARIVSTILSDSELTGQWRSEVKTMADRIIKMRSELVQGLADAGSKKDWSHITKQIGMFCYSGLSPEQCDKLASDYHIYMTRNGRISMAGVTSSTVRYLAESIHNVTK